MRGIDGLVRHLPRRRGDHLDARRVERRRVHLDVGHDDDHRGPHALPRVETEIAGAARDHQPDVSIFLAVLAHGPAHRLGHLGLRQRDVERDGARGGVEPIEMRVQAEDAAVVDADALEDAVAVQETVVEHRHGRRLAGPHLSIDVDQHDRVPGGPPCVTFCGESGALGRHRRRRAIVRTVLLGNGSVTPYLASAPQSSWQPPPRKGRGARCTVGHTRR